MLLTDIIYSFLPTIAVKQLYNYFMPISLINLLLMSLSYLTTFKIIRYKY